MLYNIIKCHKIFLALQYDGPSYNRTNNGKIIIIRKAKSQKVKRKDCVMAKGPRGGARAQACLPLLDLVKRANVLAYAVVALWSPRLIEAGLILVVARWWKP